MYLVYCIYQMVEKTPTRTIALVEFPSVSHYVLPTGANPKKIHRKSTENLQEIYRKSTGNPQEIYRKSTENPQKMLRKSTGNPQKIHRKCTENLQKSTENLLQIRGKFNADSRNHSSCSPLTSYIYCIPLCIPNTDFQERCIDIELYTCIKLYTIPSFIIMCIYRTMYN